MKRISILSIFLFPNFLLAHGGGILILLFGGGLIFLLILSPFLLMAFIIIMKKGTLLLVFKEDEIQSSKLFTGSLADVVSLSISVYLKVSGLYDQFIEMLLLLTFLFIFNGVFQNLLYLNFYRNKEFRIQEKVNVGLSIALISPLLFLFYLYFIDNIFIENHSS